MNMLELKEKAIDLGIDFSNPVVETQEQAEVVAEYIDLLDAVKNNLKGGLRDYIKTNGEVYTETKKWREKETVSYKLPATKIEDVVEKVANHFDVSEDDVWEQTNITPSIFGGQKLQVNVQNGEKVEHKNKSIPTDIYEELGASKKVTHKVDSVKK